MLVRTIDSKSESKVTIKKSHFIGFVYPITSIDEIKPIVLSLKKEYKKANHVAYGYSLTYLQRDKPFTETNYSDDGEPSKTAGYPIYNLINSNKLTNILICVVRIFGGVKLGTSGLISAYGESANVALSKLKYVEKPLTISKKIEVEISKYSFVESYLKRNKIEFISTFKGAVCEVVMDLPLESDILINLEKELLKK